MIDLNTLTDADEGRIIKVSEDELGTTMEFILAGITGGGLIVSRVPGEVCEGLPALFDPEDCELTDRRAVKAYRYGLQFRPLQLGAQPRGFIVDPSLLNKTPDWNNPLTRHGALDYPEKLDEAEVKAYELNYLGPVWRLP